MAIDLSIVIVNWNTRALLLDCLRSIYTHPPEGEFEILVVDNNSTDDSPQAVREQYPLAKLIANDCNLGFAAANNQAIKLSTGRYVLLLNPDTVVKPEGLTQLVNYMDHHPEVGGAGPLLLNPDGSLQPSCYPAPTLSREFWRLFHLDLLHPYGTYPMERWARDTVREVDIIQGACLVLRRQALDQVGVLDEDYFMYTEEVDLCFRLTQDGWRLVWVPQARVVHYGGQSTRQTPEAMFLHLHKSKLVFFRKHHPRWVAWLYKLVLIIASLVRLILSPLVYLEPASRRADYLTLARNYRSLLRSLPAM